MIHLVKTEDFTGTPPVFLTFLAGRLLPSAVGFESPRDVGYGLPYSARDGCNRLAARRPATTRPLIERCDPIAL